MTINPSLYTVGLIATIPDDESPNVPVIVIPGEAVDGVTQVLLDVMNAYGDKVEIDSGGSDIVWIGTQVIAAYAIVVDQNSLDEARAMFANW